ncbi:MAG: hypothetical protein ACOCVM_06420 [Desulfovibrionaceae bacterium]
MGAHSFRHHNHPSAGSGNTQRRFRRSLGCIGLAAALLALQPLLAVGASSPGACPLESNALQRREQFIHQSLGEWSVEREAADSSREAAGESRRRDVRRRAFLGALGLGLR